MGLLRGAVRTGVLLSAVAVAADAATPKDRKRTIGDKFANGVLKAGLLFWKVVAAAALCGILYVCFWLSNALSHAP